MKTKRIVITGGPGSGKTSIIKYIEENGFSVIHEISRSVILEAQKEGIEQLFLTNPILFSQKLLEGRLKQFHDASKYTSDFLFYDRGMPDVTAYMDFVKTDYPKNFSQICNENRYDCIFILPPWKEIYHTDNERYENYEQAESLYHYLYAAYENYGYNVINVPVGKIAERVDFIVNKLKK
ncbi:AAA family ATPase [Aequorivita echinoideorum]|uniref:AAA family ATPase n=1 Tax=Aequorivita echinoideorum TaxID=1549647 RepID=A0ABS5S4L3_9FLAO|nr:ATP-binding protein [Aequorivita echinoideorum]MBT0608166.1 AAA family ATPase [Aequorivita echinoideorum]